MADRRRDAGGVALGVIGIGVAILFWIYRPGGLAVVVGATVVAALLIAAGLIVLGWNAGPIRRLRAAAAPKDAFFQKEIGVVECQDPAAHMSEAAQTAALIGVLRDLETEIDESIRLIQPSRDEGEGWLPPKDLPVGAWKANRAYLRQQTGIQSILYPLGWTCRYAENFNSLRRGGETVHADMKSDPQSALNSFAAARTALQHKIWELDGDQNWLPNRAVR